MTPFLQILLASCSPESSVSMPESETACLSARQPLSPEQRAMLGAQQALPQTSAFDFQDWSCCPADRHILLVALAKPAVHGQGPT